MKWIRAVCLALLCLVLLLFSTGCPKSETQPQDTTDTTAPSTPFNLTKTSADSVYTPTFTWSPANDTGSGIAYYLGRIDSESFVNIGNVTTYTALDALSEGSHAFEVKAVDKAGNESTTAVITFVVGTPTTPSASDLFLRIVSVTSPVGAGGHATLEAQTLPNVQCTIVVYYKSGPSQAQGLYPKAADGNGNVSWTWMVGTRTTPGSWRIVVTANFDNETVTETTYFTVQ